MMDLHQKKTKKQKTSKMVCAMHVNHTVLIFIVHMWGLYSIQRCKILKLQQSPLPVEVSRLLGNVFNAKLETNESY